jgi:hypothetical protein
MPQILCRKRKKGHTDPQLDVHARSRYHFRRYKGRINLTRVLRYLIRASNDCYSNENNGDSVRGRVFSDVHFTAIVPSKDETNLPVGFREILDVATDFAQSVANLSNHNQKLFYLGEVLKAD